MVEFRVLRCAHCQTFQVLQVTKSPKWKCKLCDEKQSVLKDMTFVSKVFSKTLVTTVQEELLTALELNINPSTQLLQILLRLDRPEMNVEALASQPNTFLVEPSKVIKIVFSFFKEYGRGTGADCRRHVQKLNTMRMEIDTAAEKNRLGSACCESSSSISNSDHMENADQDYLFTEQKKTSHWEAFLAEDKSDENEDYRSAINVKSEGDVCVDYGGTEDEEGIRVTTDWSAYQNERKRIWRNKRKLDHNRSKLNKSAKYGDDNNETYISVNSSHGRKSCPYTTDKRFEPTWKQNRYNASHLQNQVSKGVDSQIRSVPSLSAHATMKNLALPSASTSSSESKGINSNDFFCVGNNDSKGHNNNTDSEQESFLKLRFDSESCMLPAASSSDVIKKATLPIQSSKWNTFITEMCDDDSNSNDDSDSEAAFQNFTNKFNCDNTSDTLKPLPDKGSSNSYVPNPISKWNTFVDDKNSGFDDDAVNEDDFNSCDVNKKCNENIYSNKIRKSVIIDQVSGIYNNESKDFESLSQSVMNGINEYDEKRVNYKRTYGRNITESIEPVSQAKMGDIGKQSSLFQIDVDDDNDAWDLDL